MTALRTAVRAAALAGPVALAFASGGFHPEAREVALVAIGVLLAAWALAGPAPFPRDRRVLLALGAFAAYCAWVAISAGWAPQADTARGDLERVLLYLGALALGAALWTCRRAARWVEPAVAAGILVVMAYGLAGRLLPGIVELDPGRLAGARLFQPLSYWNGQGALAAIGLLLCARLTGDRTRPAAVRVLAAAASVPIGTALYLTFSRGALAAFAGGALILLALAPTWSQLRALAIAVEATALGIAGFRLLGGVHDLDPSSREGDGAIALALLLILMLVAAAVAAWAHRVEDEERTRLGRLPLPERAPLIAAALAVALVVVPVLLPDDGAPRFAATSDRLVTTGSNRDEYWAVALRAAADHPVQGLGSGGFAREWLRERPIGETVRDAHSLYLETLAELGLVGLLLLLAAFAAIAACGRAAYRADPALAAGPIAALAAYAIHAGIDWDWELPALTLVAIGLSGLLLSRASRSAD